MKKQPRVIHVLSNGQTVNSIAGRKIPVDNPVYEIILKGAKK